MASPLVVGRQESRYTTGLDKGQAACIEATLDALAAGECPKTVAATDKIKSLPMVTGMVTGMVARARESRRITIEACR